MDIKRSRQIRLAAGIVINAAGLGVVLGYLAQQMVQNLPTAL